jgi:Holliday junction resolvasome RuvABC endonuclease subunit
MRPPALKSSFLPPKTFHPQNTVAMVGKIHGRRMWHAVAAPRKLQLREPAPGSTKKAVTDEGAAAKLKIPAVAKKLAHRRRFAGRERG